MLKHIQKLLILVLAFAMPVLVASDIAVASSAPVQFTIPDTTLTIKGFASPGAFVQIVDGNVLIGTTIANSSGIFEKDFTAMRAGLHTFRISYQDSDGLQSDQLTQTVNIRAQSDTAVEYFLPPTLQTNPVSVVEGELITFSGSTIPNAIVELTLDGGATILRPQSDASGRYAITVDTTGYYFGQHTAAAASSQGGLSSVQTLKKQFIVIPIESDAGGDSDAGELFPPTIETIDGEINGDDSPVLIRGTGPPNSQIIIYLDGEPIGSTFTSADGTWFFNVDVLSASQDVRAVACDGPDCSNFSNLARIIYSGDPEACSVQRFWLAEYRFWEIREDNGINLSITGMSGTPPYEVILDWGDVTTERFNRNTAQSFKVHHVYEREGNYNGNITIIDDTGCEYTRYFSVDVIERGIDSRWLLGLAGGIVILTLYLRRRYRVHRKKLILAR